MSVAALFGASPALADVIISPSSQTVQEGAGGATTPVTINITRNAGLLAGAAQVDVATHDGTATAASGDYTPVATSLFFPATLLGYSQTQQVTVDVNDDALNEGPEAFTVTATPLNETGGGTVTVNIADNDPLPHVAIGNAAAKAEGGTLQFPVTLDHVSGRDVTVHVAPSGGTATAGTDYTAPATTVTIPAGQLSATVNVPTIDDTVDEDDETVQLAISQPVNAALGATTTATGTITDNDLPPTVTIGNDSVTEGNAPTGGVLHLPVTLSAASSKPVTVNYAVTGDTATAGQDFTLPSGTVTIPAGSRTATIDVQVIGDTTDENDETLTATLTGATNATIGTPASGTGTIVDDDNPPSISAAASPASVAEGTGATGGTLHFNVSLSQASGKTITVAYSVGGGTATPNADFTPSTGTLTFAPGDTTKGVDVPIVGDALNEPNETVVLSLSNASNASIATPTATGTITDDDATPSLSIADASTAEGDSGTKKLTFTVTLSAPSGQDVSFDYATHAGTADTNDADPASGTKTIPAGQTTATIDVTIHGDTTIEPDDTFTVVLSNPVRATIGDGTATGTIVNDDFPTVTIGDGQGTEGGSVDLKVSLSQAGFQPTTVTYAVSPGSASTADYGSTGGTLTIPAGQLSGTISIGAADDDIHEADETFTVTLTGATNGVLGAAKAATGTIKDNDPVPAFSIGNASVNEGNSGTSQLAFPVTIDRPSSADVSVKFTVTGGTADSADFDGGTGTLVIPAGSTKTAALVTVHGDTTVEPDETVVVDLSDPSGATIANGHAVGTIVNDDSAATTGSNAGSSNTSGSSSTGGVQQINGSASGGPKVALTKLKISKGTVSITVTCPKTATNCRGQLSVLTVASAKSKVKQLRREIKLGSKVYVVGAGKSATITLRLSKQNLAILRKGKKVAARAYAVTHDNAGNTGTSQLSATLKA